MGCLESRPEQVGGGCKVAIHSLDPGIPVGMTTESVLSWVLSIPGAVLASLGKHLGSTLGVVIQPLSRVMLRARQAGAAIAESDQPVYPYAAMQQRTSRCQPWPINSSTWVLTHRPRAERL
jgi:hypothetical protein